jgi:hypothetical protein
MRARSNSAPARPYMARLSIFNLLIWPSACPLLQCSRKALVTAAISCRTVRFCCKPARRAWDVASLARANDGWAINEDQGGAFKGRYFTANVILWALRWYLAFPGSYRDVAQMLSDRGVAVDHTTIFRWVQAYAAMLEKRLRPHLRRNTGSWRVDETYIKVKGAWTYLYRAVDSLGQTIDFLLSPRRDAASAKRFFRKALAQVHTGNPRTRAPVQTEFVIRPRDQAAAILYSANPVFQISGAVLRWSRSRERSNWRL